jgi:hypothetical protein
MSKFSQHIAIIRSNKIWSTIIATALIILISIFWHNTDPIQSFADNFWAVIDPVAGIMTFFITLIILFIQAKTNWENGLEKRLSIIYMFIDPMNKVEVPLVNIENAYLSGDADIRPWAQSLGGQIMGNMDFDMNWDDPKPTIIYDTKMREFYKKYEVIMYLTSNPLDTEKGKETFQNFLQRSFKYSKVSGDLNNLPIIWTRS